LQQQRVDGDVIVSRNPTEIIYQPGNVENVEGTEESVTRGVIMVSVDTEYRDCNVDIRIFVVDVGDCPKPCESVTPALFFCSL